MMVLMTRSVIKLMLIQFFSPNIKFVFLFSLKKKTKNSVETGRTFATLLCDMETRQLLIEVGTEEEFKVMILNYC